MQQSNLPHSKVVDEFSRMYSDIAVTVSVFIKKPHRVDEANCSMSGYWVVSLHFDFYFDELPLAKRLNRINELVERNVTDKLLSLT